MVGHSKWSKVKHIKGPPDVRRGVAVGKLVKEITPAARLGSGDLSGHQRLRPGVETARAAGSPKDDIHRAIKKDSCGLSGERCQKTFYESSAAGRVALFPEAATHIKNRTTASLRFILSKHPGHSAANGRVSYPFHPAGPTTLQRPPRDEARCFAPAFAIGVDVPPAKGMTADSQKHPYLSSHAVVMVDAPSTARVLHLDEMLDAIQHAHSHSRLPEDLLVRISA